MALSTIGTDPDYNSLLAQRSDPRLLMAQKLMEVEKMPTNNSTKSSFWANLLNQGARGALGGYMYGDVQADRKKEAAAQEAEAKTFREKMERGPPGGGSGGTGTAPAQPPAQRGSSGNAAAGAGPTEPLGRGVLPPEQQQAIVTAATQGTMVPPDLANAVITQESGWKPGARGKGSDSGLGQVTNSTAADPGYGLPPLSDADRLDPQKNAAWSMRYLEARGKAAGLTRPEDWQNPAKVALALKAYNGGGDPNYVANVTRHLRTSDAGDVGAGSNMEALLSGVDAPKPRGIQLAANLLPNGTATDAPTPILPQLPDASPVPGGLSPKVNALFDAIEQAKSNQARARVALGGVSPNEPFGRGNTATDAPTPILSAPRVPVASAALQGASGPQPPSADVPQPPPATVPAPPAATVPQPEMATVPQPEPAVVPQPEMATVPQPEMATVPQPEPAVVPQPEPAVVPAAQPPVETGPAGSGETGGQPTALPQEQPPAATAPAGSGETGGQPTALPQEEPPLPVPPIPPGLLARRLVGGGGPNATEALNTASLAAARKGENFSPGAGPSGQQLAAPLMSWAGNLGADGAPVLTPQPTGPQLAAPLLPPRPDGSSGGGAPGAASQQGAPPVTPTSGPGDPGGDPGATGGQSKAPQAPAQPAPQAQPDGSSGRDDQAKADWYLSMAREAAGSSNPKVRANAGVLEAQGMALQRRIDRQDALNQQLDARRDARQLALDSRNLPIHDLTLGDGKVHSVQIMPDGSHRDLGLSGNQHAQAERNSETKDVLVGNDVHIFERDRNSGTWKDTGLLSGNQRPERDPAMHTVKLRGDDGQEHEFIVKPDGTKTDLGPTKGAGGDLYPGKDASSTDRNIIDRLRTKVAGPDATEEDKLAYSRSYNALKNGMPVDIQDPQDPSRQIRVPGKPMDLTGYPAPPYHDDTPLPGKPPNETERVAAGYATRMVEANKTLDEKGTQTFGDVMAGRVPVVGNYLTSDQGQQFQTAARAWIWAKLRKESGAAVPPAEAQQEFETYFPQPGDTPGRIALKKHLRDVETLNMQHTAGNAYTPASGGGGAPVRITSDEEFDKLKPGQQFIGPDGKTRTK